MKKIAIVCLSVLIAVVPLGTASCRKEPKPYFAYLGYGEREKIFETETYLLPAYSDEQYFNSYKLFLSYYDKEFTFKNAPKAYILDPGFPMGGIGPNIYYSRSFNIFTNGKDENGLHVQPLFREYISLYDPDYIDYVEYFPDCKHLVGWFAESVCLSYYTVPVEGITGNDFILEFGKNESDEFMDKFINIYIDKTCIGTCYYKEYLPMSQEWFENYFKKNLILR